MNLQTRILELGIQGFECSQIMAILALETQGMENPDLVRAMSGLTGGMGHYGKTCGVLTGGCCILGLFTGKGDKDEMEHEDSRRMIQEYVVWFEEEVGIQYGGCDCDCIINKDYSKCVRLCAPIIELAYEKLTEILDGNGVID